MSQELENLREEDTGYEAALTRMLLMLGTAIGATLDLVLIILFQPSLWWCLIPGSVVAMTLWMVTLEFRSDWHDTREIEMERRQLINQLGFYLAQNPEDEYELPDDFPEEDEDIPDETAYRRATLSDRVSVKNGLKIEFTDELNKEPYLTGISDEYPDPRAFWGKKTMGTLYEIMQDHWRQGVNSEYAFVYGVASGLAVSQTSWQARKLNKTRWGEWMQKLATAGVVSDLSQGQRERVVYIKNPVQAYLMVLKEHNPNGVYSSVEVRH